MPLQPAQYPEPRGCAQPRSESSPQGAAQTWTPGPDLNPRPYARRNPHQQPGIPWPLYRRPGATPACPNRPPKLSYFELGLEIRAQSLNVPEKNCGKSSSSIP